MKGLNDIMKKLKMDKWIRRMDWYIIKKFLGTYFFAIALIISIAVVFDVNEWIDNFINNKAPVKAIIFDYYANFIPYFFESFQSVVCLHCGYFLYVQIGGKFRNYRDDIDGNEFQASLASVYDIGSHHFYHDLWYGCVRDSERKCNSSGF